MSREMIEALDLAVEIRAETNRFNLIKAAVSEELERLSVFEEINKTNRRDLIYLDLLSQPYEYYTLQLGVPTSKRRDRQGHLEVVHELNHMVSTNTIQASIEFIE